MNNLYLLDLILVLRFIYYSMLFFIRKKNYKNWTTMEKVETVVVLELWKWENGKWKFGIKARILRNIVVLRSCIFANIV